MSQIWHGIRAINIRCPHEREGIRQNADKSTGHWALSLRFGRCVWWCAELVFTTRNKSFLFNVIYVCHFWLYGASVWFIPFLRRLPIWSAIHSHLELSRRRPEPSERCWSCPVGVKTLRTQDISALARKCLMDTSAPGRKFGIGQRWIKPWQGGRLCLHNYVN